MPDHPLSNHRAHDYRALIREWRTVARQKGLKMRPFARVAGVPVYVVSSPPARKDQRATIYISAGIHGDEPAAPWGLLAWAAAQTVWLETHRFLIFPTLNPIGLALNTRVDQDGLDLNRSFNLPDHSLITAWQRVIAGHELALGLCLHEDYDGQGCYLYELNPGRDIVGRKILADCEAVLPIDTRKKIDGRAANDGLIARRLPPELPGHPEAIVLHLLGAPLTLTFESPSEFSLHDRIEVQKKFINSALVHGLPPR